MSALRVLSVFGTRPEAIKMAPLVRLLAGDPDIESHICVTAQHREMLDQVLDVFDIKPNYDLNLMAPNQDLSSLTTAVLSGLDPILNDFAPDIVCVHGDTTTTLATAIASFHRQIDVAHVEAGLRTGDLAAPWPEEGNRKVVGSLAKLHFAPTSLARTNLIDEGVPSERIHVTGNTVIDALQIALEKIEESGTSDLVAPFIDPSARVVLITGHRRENFGSGFQRICTAIRELALEHPRVQFVYPVHLNPRVQDPVRLLLHGCPNVHLVEPMGYLPFVSLMNRSYLVLTDSGGIQEEAPAIGKPVLVMREKTERPEGIAAGTVLLVGTDVDRIVNSVSSLLNSSDAYSEMSGKQNPYGDGHAAERIVKVLKEMT